MKISKIRMDFPRIWLWLMLFIISGSAVYFLYALDWIGMIASLLIASILFLGLKSKISVPKPEHTSVIATRSTIISGITSIVLSLIALLILFSAQTDAAIISPWSEVSAWYFVTIFLSGLALINTLSTQASNVFKGAALFAYLLSIFSVAAIVYRLGYGFDPFIHQAAMAEISRYGFILPKTPYYLGQYSLVAFLDKIGLSVIYVNRWLLPALSAISLPFLFSLLHHGRRNKEAVWIASLSLLLVSFSPLIMTTPQNFSYLLLLATVIMLYKGLPWPLSLATAAATFAVHPLSGLPALFLTLWILTPKVLPRIQNWRIYKRPLYVTLVAFAVLSLSIWAIAGFGRLHLQSFNLSLLTPMLTNKESYLLDLSYFLIKNHLWLLLAGAIVIFFWRRRLWKPESHSGKMAIILSLSSIAALAAYLLSRGFQIEGLIAYEQDDYAARLPIIALILLIPLYWELLYEIIRRSRLLPGPARIIAAAGLSLLLLVAVYGSYPRLDNYHNSRGYSTSQTDVEAVRKVETEASGEKYIVLANQQVSAAALREFGFRNRYRQDDRMFFYPIPTGGTLYRYFLDMVYVKADRETMERAMDEAGVDKAYLIINRYWWASDKIIAEAKLSADSWERLDRGEIHIFEYDR